MASNRLSWLVHIDTRTHIYTTHMYIHTYTNTHAQIEANHVTVNHEFQAQHCVYVLLYHKVWLLGTYVC